MVACFILMNHPHAPPPPLPGLLHGFLSPGNSVSPEPLPRSLLLFPHLHWVTHLLQAQDFKFSSPALGPSPTAPWAFPPGCPQGTTKSKYPNQLHFWLSLSQLVAPLTTQSPKLQLREPPLTPACQLSPHLTIANSTPQDVFSILISASWVQALILSLLDFCNHRQWVNGLGFLAESCPHYIHPLSRPPRDIFEDATLSLKPFEEVRSQVTLVASLV